MKFFFLVAVALCATVTSPAQHVRDASMPAVLHGMPTSFAFTDFHLRAINNAVMLTWKTADESSGGAFTIERSHNELDYEPIGTLSVLHRDSYSYSDNAPLNGDNFYRILYIDKDGKKTYSKTVPVTLSARNSIKAFAGYGKVTARIDLNEPGTYHIAIVNSYGQALHKEDIRYDSSQNTFDIQTGSQLPPGIYSVILKGNNVSLSCQVLIK